MKAGQDTFRASGVITLTTDFGLHDPFVGIVKGIIARRCPSLSVIDLCHEVPPFSAEIGGLWIGLSYRWFSPGSVHVAVVDPGVGTDRRIVCLQAGQHLFLVPDNGLAGELTRHLDKWSARALEPETLSLDSPSPTFHGRDIFAPVAAMLAAGELTPEVLGPPVDDLTPSALPRPCLGKDDIVGEVLLADRFGNLFSNIAGPIPAAWNDARVTIDDHSMRLVRTYDEARSGEFVAIFNSFGLLEIALPRGNARATGQWPPGTHVRLFRTS